MTKLIFAVAMTGIASIAYADSEPEPVMEVPVIVEDTVASSSATGVWVPLSLLTAAAAIVAAD